MRKPHWRCPGEYPRRTRWGHHRAKAHRTWQKQERTWSRMNGCLSAKKDGFAFYHIESCVFLIGRVRKGGSPRRFQVLEDFTDPIGLLSKGFDDPQTAEVPKCFLLFVQRGR